MLLAEELISRGHSVRATTRRAERCAGIEAVGAEAVVGDPDRVATLAGALEHVSVACVLLGSAVGPPADLDALHGPRLEMLLSRMLDSTVRGIVWEASGTVDPATLRDGASRVVAFCEDSRIPYALLGGAFAEWPAWVDHAAALVEGVLSPRAVDSTVTQIGKNRLDL